MPASRRRAVKAKLVNWLPWSVLKISGVPYAARASSSASVQKPASSVFSESHLHDFDSHLQSQSSGVLGLYLVRKYADTISYRQQGDRNHLVLSKIISRKPN